MGETPERVITAGAPGVFNALNIPLMPAQALSDSLDGFPLGSSFLVVTLHAATLAEGNPLEIQENMLASLSRLLPDTRLIITYPNCDVDPAPLIDSLRRFESGHSDCVKVVPSLGRLRYLSAVALSDGVVGNSSSALVEVPSLGVPSLDIGTRQKGRECGPSVIHCGVSSSDISAGLSRILSSEMRHIAAQRVNPYFTPGTPYLIADTILSSGLRKFPSKSFHLI